VVGVDARLPHALAHAYKALHLLTTSPVEWEQVFEDKFQRADGPVGSNYITGMMGTPPLNVTGHAACANTQAVAISTKVSSPMQLPCFSNHCSEMKRGMLCVHFGPGGVSRSGCVSNATAMAETMSMTEMSVLENGTLLVDWMTSSSSAGPMRCWQMHVQVAHQRCGHPGCTALCFADSLRSLLRCASLTRTCMRDPHSLFVNAFRSLIGLESTASQLRSRHTRSKGLKRAYACPLAWLMPCWHHTSSNQCRGCEQCSPSLCSSTR